jgi:hypothetical protein
MLIPVSSASLLLTAVHLAAVRCLLPLPPPPLLLLLLLLLKFAVLSG